jgi:threonine dehydratase
VTIVRQPTRAGVRDAAAKITAILAPSPLFTHEINGVTIAFKAESLQPIGAFKLRGAWHRLTALDDHQRTKGVVAFSSGNHAQGVAWAAKRLGIPATIVMPSDAPKAKRDGTLALGAEVVPYDRMTEDRVRIAAELAEARGAVLVPSFDDSWIIEGQRRDRGAAADGSDRAGRTDPCRDSLRRRRTRGGNRAWPDRGQDHRGRARRLG